MPNFIKLTVFNFLHATDSEEIDIDANEIQSMRSAESGEGDGYTSIAMTNGAIYAVKERISDINERIEEAEQKISSEESNDSKAS